MANNIRVTGVAYCSKAGDDADSGLTKDLPKASFNALSALGITNDLLVVASGVYAEAVNATSGGREYKSDGLVVFKGDGANDFYLTAAGGTSFLEINGENGGFIIENYNSVIFGFTNNLNKVTIKNCLVKQDCTIYPRANSVNFAVLINNIFTGAVNITKTNTTLDEVQYCIFMDDVTSSVSLSVPTFQNCYIATAATVSLNYLKEDRFYNNCVRGVVLLAGDDYAVQDELTGTPQDNGYIAGVEWLTEANLIANGLSGADALGWDAAAATCINKDPLFNNAALYDFSVSPLSPLLGAASDGISNIGNVNVGYSFDLVSSTLAIESSVDITNTVNVLSVTSPAGEGSVIFTPFLVASGLKVTIENFKYLGALLFDSDETGGTAGNINVPDTLNYTAASAGQNPNRLSYQMRWSDVESLTAPTSWNNGGLVTTDNYSNFEIEQIPLIDDGGLGNGDAAFNIANNGQIEAVWVQIKVILRNDYASS